MLCSLHNFTHKSLNACIGMFNSFNNFDLHRKEFDMALNTPLSSPRHTIFMKDIMTCADFFVVFSFFIPASRAVSYSNNCPSSHCSVASNWDIVISRPSPLACSLPPPLVSSWSGEDIQVSKSKSGKHNPSCQAETEYLHCFTAVSTQTLLKQSSHCHSSGHSLAYVPRLVDSHCSFQNVFALDFGHF